MHLVDLSVGFLGAMPIVGSIIPIAVGTAFGSVITLQQKRFFDSLRKLYS